jgi:hypothetical protein
MVHVSNPAAPASEWLDSLDESEAELAAGQTVNPAAMRRRLRDSIARLEEHLANEDKQKAALPR